MHRPVAPLGQQCEQRAGHVGCDFGVEFRAAVGGNGEPLGAGSGGEALSCDVERVAYALHRQVEAVGVAHPHAHLQVLLPEVGAPNLDVDDGEPRRGQPGDEQGAAGERGQGP